MKPTVVIAYAGFEDMEVEYSVLGTLDLHIMHTGTLTTPDAVDAAQQCDALIVTLQEVRADLISTMARCRLISRAGTGLDTIDINAATEHGIWVSNVPDYSIDEVSTHAIALLLNHARSLFRLFDATRRGEWDNSVAVPGRRLQGQILGVVGFGRIGRAAAQKGLGLGLEVMVFDPYVEAETIAAKGMRPADLNTLLREADYITLHTPLTDDTRHMINARTLSLMKPNAYLINVARGELIDEDALAQALREERIDGAALDVLAVEPPPADHPLLHDERILITPHAAWYSEEAKYDMRVRACEEVVRVLRGEPPRAAVNQIHPHS